MVHGVEFALVLKHQDLVLQSLASLEIRVSDADLGSLRRVILGHLEYPASWPKRRGSLAFAELSQVGGKLVSFRKG